MAVVFLATVAAVCGAPDCSRQPVDKLRVTMAGINLIKSFESFHGPCYLDKLVSKKDCKWSAKRAHTVAGPPARPPASHTNPQPRQTPPACGQSAMATRARPD